MSVSYEDAMDTLRAMFENFDRDFLSCILEANDGHLERTIDTLLEGIRVDGTTAESAASRAFASAPIATVDSHAQWSIGRQPCGLSLLPEDFLRVPGDKKEASVSDQEMQDRMLAEMLQNELFRQELMADREFTNIIDNNHSGRQQQATVSRSSQEKSAMDIANETLNALGSKISTMSEGT
jgi:hypothetical protein